MLRTAISPAAQRRARQALPGLVAGVVAVVAVTLLGSRPGTLAALLLYVVSLAWWGSAALAPLARVRPREFAAASVGAALAWWCVGLALVVVRLVRAPDWAGVVADFGPVVAVLVVGFATQLLLGALSYLLPSVLGGGKRAVRAAQHHFDRWATARLVVVNAGLALCLLPVPALVRVVVSVLVLVALAAFVPLMVAGLRAGVRAGATPAPAPAAPGSTPAPAAAPGATPRATPRVTGPDHLPSIWSGAQAVAAVSALLVAITLGVAGDPGAAGLDTSGSGAAQAAAQVTPTGRTTRVRVEARGMRFHPARVEVPVGDRLVVDLVNADPSDVHDLLVQDQRTPRLSPGGSATLDAGVVGASSQGWCTIVGHRQMGMTLDIVATGTAAPTADAANPSTAQGHSGHDGSPAGAALIDPAARVASPIDPALAPLPAPSSSARPRVHTLTLRVTQTELEVAPGVRQQRWTYNGHGVGPTLRGRVGDVFDVTLVNDGTMGHSVDFHAGALAPDQPMRTIAPGASLRYRFTATRAGIWMYHCSTHPMSAHIAAGMHGAVIIEPAAGLPPVDREYALVQSEIYVAPGTGAPGEAVAEVDADAVVAERPTFAAFNGIAAQYDQHPLTATVGQRVRIWVLDAGPNRPSAFHVVGGQFDTVYREGSYELGPQAAGAGSQALGLLPAQGGFVELTFPEPGRYPIVSHVMIDAERGAHGYVDVSR